MPDYQQGKIYKIVSENCNLVYYGSTIQTLKARMKGHITSYNSWKKTGKLDCTSSLVLEFGEAEFVLVEDFPCKTKTELLIRETYYFDNFDCVNVSPPYRTTEERKEKKSKTSKIYSITNKEKINYKGKLYRDNNVEKEKERHKLYRDNNKEKIQERHKLYRKNNRRKIQDCENKRRAWKRITKEFNAILL